MTEKEARAALNQAVEDYIDAAGWRQGWVITGWALAVDQLQYDDDGAVNSAFVAAYRDGFMPASQAIGLFTLALDSVRGVG
jgi:hypothetical protein